ncbi:uncharacterized protein [Pseudochaenichthys georgianus]|uniref:uncharacterized protein isoform X2 n=1 Tax=Pseudochaenichthys georgianus TaxID=52239 RepID=UPI00146F0613|nr:uncharacterized protein LOC117447576 isoform X3 [Pseudochaenichthys georgianus]
MSKVETLRAFVNERLAAAAEEIFELFERTIAEELESTLKENRRQQKLLDALLNPEVRLYRTDIGKATGRQGPGMSWKELRVPYALEPGPHTYRYPAAGV